MFVPPKILHWNLIVNVMVLGGGILGRWLGHKGRAEMNGICVLIKETSESSSAPSTLWDYSKKMAVYDPGKWVSQYPGFGLFSLQNFEK